MSRRTLATLAIALVLGLVAALLARATLTARGPASRAGEPAEMTPVVVAALSIDRGAVLKSPMLKVAQYPSGSVPAGAFRSVGDIMARPGSPVVMRSLAANEPVLSGKLSGGAANLNLSGALTPGLRAVSIRSDDVHGVAGFVLPGDRVDVLVTRPVDGAAGGSVTQVLAENCLVLAVDQISDPEASKPMVAKTVTLEATPEAAQAFSLAQAVGTVSLTLRQASDSAALARKTTTLSDLAAAPRAPPPARPKTSPVRRSFAQEVTVTRGVETSRYAMGPGS